MRRIATALLLLLLAITALGPNADAQNTALNRTTVALLVNKSGGALVLGDVVVLDNTNAKGFTTTTTGALSSRGMGVILERNGIANNGTGLVAVGGWVPKINLNTAATVGQFIKTHTVAGQGTPHSSPQVEGDFAVALQASATPEALLFGKPNGPGTSGTVSNTGTLTSGKVIIGNGGTDITVASTTGIAKLASGTLSAASAGTDYNAPTTSGTIRQVVNTETGTSATGTTAMVMDDTIPQNTEGDQYMSLAVTPTSSSNLLKVEVVAHTASNQGTRWHICALFQDSTADALASGFTWQLTANVVMNIKFTHWMTAGTTSSTTFKVRCGTDTSGTTTFNGATGTRRLGGAIASSITITEFVP